MKSTRTKQQVAVHGLRGERAQAAIELMLVFPLFIFITLIAVEFGVWMYQSVNIANSVREAARYGAVNCNAEPAGCTDDLIEQRAIDKSNGALSAGDLTIGWVARDAAAAGDKGSSIVVKADHDHGLIFSLPIISTINLPIIACVDMRLERNDPGTVGTGSDC